MMQLRTLSDGHVCCSQLDEHGQHVIPAVDRMCDACKAHYAQHASAPPDPYARDLQRLRAANQKTDATSIFERQFKAERLAALTTERRSIEEPQPRLTTAELARYAPPNGYQLALDKLKEKR